MAVFFQGTIFLQIQVSKHPFLASLQGSQSSLSFVPNYKTQYSAPGDLLIVVSNSSIFFSMHRINVHSKRNAAIKLQKHHFMGLKGYSV